MVINNHFIDNIWFYSGTMKNHKKNLFVFRESLLALNQLFKELVYFATFLLENIIFSSIFWAGPPPEKLKSKKKKSLSDFGPPPLTNSWTRACT